ncbi:mucin-associated surface protein [Trypanosoma cruzi cruzi]|uniref:Mucin-associated surface protein (MASP) n=1 Tax=Trypanosoma cruzi TaxID=5693 RepID=A0A2V2VBP6_TRYCR|nr:mucin-associated surface protein [Trypanosoma cruzi cruzi]PWU93830.1 Mucin-associated surface protein (MASP) [Trypanosoma cruzi]
MAMMTGRVLLVCALCVLWCDLAEVGVSFGDDVTEIQDEPSRSSQSLSKGGHEEELDIRNPVGGVLNTSEEPLDSQDIKKVSPQTSANQPPRDNGGAARKEEKVEVKKAEDEETRSDGEEQTKDHSDETQESDGPKENGRNPSPTPADKRMTSEDPAAERAGQAGQAIRPPQSPVPDVTRPSGSSQGDSSVSPLSMAGISPSSALDAPFVQSTQPSQKGPLSEAMSLGTALPKEQPKERSEPKAKHGSSTSEETAESPDDSGDALQKEKKGDVGLKATTGLSSTTSNPPVTKTTPRLSSAEPSPTTTELQVGEETSTENFTITKRNDTATPGNNDGSTAVSHATSPLLLLVVVACAAAAAVVAA